MPILLERMEDLKEYVEENPQAHVFYKRRDRTFEVLAGKVAWAGEVDSEKDADYPRILPPCAWGHGGEGLGGARRALFKLILKRTPFFVFLLEELVAPLLAPQFEGVQAPVQHPV